MSVVFQALGNGRKAIADCHMVLPGARCQRVQKSALSRPPIFHCNNTISQSLQKSAVVAHDQDGGTAFGGSAQEIADAPGGETVEGAGGFVGDEQRWAFKGRARNGNTLTLADRGHGRDGLCPAVRF